MKRCLYHLLMVVVLLAAGLTSARAGEEVDKKVKELPHLLGSTNTGTDFWMTFLPAWPIPGGINNIKIYVSSGVETEVVVEVKSEGWIKVKKTKPNDIIEFVLPVTIAQPYFKIDRDPTPPEKVYRQHAVHVYSKDPIICYGVTRYQYTSDGFLAIPTSGLGKNYQVASFSDVGDNGTSFGQYLPSLTSVVAPYDNTKVIFTLGGNLITRTAGGLKPGESKSWTLNKGDVLPIGSFGKSADLSGSIITSSKPVGVISGNFCAYIPEDKAACDHICEMELPVNTWGKAYHVTRIFGRQNNSLIKVFAAKPNTKIYLDGRHVYTIQTPGGVEGTGWMFRRVAEGAPKSYILSADGPISVSQHNPGQQDDNISSDPFQLVLTPIEQFQTEITFNTPGIGDGSGFARNYVNVVFQLDEKREMPIDLEWAVVENGQFEWKSVGERYGFFYEPFEHDVDGKAYGMKTVVIPRDGVYKIRAKLPFAAYAYGFSDYDSYGFPTSVALGDLTIQDTVKPESPFEEDCKGCYKNITVKDLPENEDARSNLAEIYMDNANSYNYDFSFVPFVAGEDQSTRWSACPIDASQDARAILYFKDRAGNTHIDTLDYRAFSVTITPSPLVDFGSFKVGDEHTVDVTLTNSSKINRAEISKIEFSNPTAGFSINTPLSIFIEPSSSVVVPVKFTATIASPDANADGRPDPFTTDMTVGNDCGETKVKLTAIVGEPVISVHRIDFGQVPVGTPLEKSVEIFNKGSMPLTITAASDPTFPVYTIKPGTLPDFPFEIPAGGKQPFTVIFRPTAEQDYPDQIVFENTAGTNEDNVCELTGTGVAPGLLITPMTWNRLRVDLGVEEEGTIEITNTGTQSVSIIDPLPDGNEHFTFIDRNLAKGDLPPGGKKTLKVKFHPKDIGLLSHTLVFKSSLGEDRTSLLSGTGVYAKVIAINPNDFGVVDIPGGTPTTRDIEFVVTGSNDPMSEPIEITGLQRVEGDDGFFSYDIANKLFREDGTPINSFPIIVPQGGKLILRDVEFAPTVDGPHVRSMRILATDDTHPHATNNLPAEWISVWNGEGNLIQTGVGDVEAQPLAFELCQNESDGQTLNFNNPFLDPVTVGSIELQQTGSEFALSGVPATPLELEPNGTGSFTVLYTPTGTGSHTAKVVFKDAGGATLKEVTITGIAKAYATKLVLSNTQQNAMKPGAKFGVRISNPNDISDPLAAFKDVTLTLTYDGTVTDAGDVVAGPDYNVSPPVHGFNTLTFTVSPKSADIMPSGELATVTFSSYLAQNKQSDIRLANSGQNSSPCLSIEGDTMDISIVGLCVLNLRAVSTTGEKFGMSQNYPNPSSNQTTIDLSVAFDVPATLTLYNSMGEVVDVLMSEQLPAGKYQIDLTTTNLPSGTYFYRVEAGPFVESRQMVIAK